MRLRNGELSFAQVSFSKFPPNFGDDLTKRRILFVKTAVQGAGAHVESACEPFERRFTVTQFFSNQVSEGIRSCLLMGKVFQ